MEHRLRRRAAAARSIGVAVVSPAYAHNPFLYAGDRRRACRMIETAFRKECATRLSGELVVLGAAVEVRLFGQPVERRQGKFGAVRL
jgi:hypothetical protein